MKKQTGMTKQQMLALRLQGHTYRHIASKAGVSYQWVQQSLSPPKEVRDFIVNKCAGLCRECGILVGSSGHVHHIGLAEENYQDIENLELLCASCHRAQHPTQGYAERHTATKQSQEIRALRKELGLSQRELAERLGVHKRTVIFWEAGEFEPSPMAQAKLKEIRPWTD